MSPTITRQYINEHIKKVIPSAREIANKIPSQRDLDCSYFVEYGSLTTTSYDQTVYFDEMPLKLLLWFSGNDPLKVRDKALEKCHALRLEVTKRINFEIYPNINLVSHSSTTIELDETQNIYACEIDLNFDLKFANN